MTRLEIRKVYKDFIEKKDKLSFGVLYELLFKDLIYHPYSILNDMQQAEDIVSDVLIKLWLDRHEFTEDMDIKAYLVTAVKHKCLDILKSKSYKGKISAEERDHLLERLKNSDQSPFDILVFQDLWHMLKQAISEMEGDHKKVFELIKLKGHTYKEVAEMLSISEKTVEKYMRENLKIYDKYELPEIRKKKRSNRGGGPNTLSILIALFDQILIFFNFFSKKRRVSLD